MVEASDPTLEWLKNESMGDATLLRLIGAREQVIKEGVMLIHAGGTIPEPLRAELDNVGQLITLRKVKLSELQVQSGGDEIYFHLLVAADDLREAVEANKDDALLWERWEEAKAAVREYQGDGVPPFTE